jgi:hypothetical protein
MDERPDQLSVPSDSLTGAEAMAWVDGLLRRGVICLLYELGLLLARLVLADPPLSGAG